MAALSRRLVKEELRRGSLRLVAVRGWPLSAKIQVVMLKDCYVSTAMRHFLQLVRDKMPEGRFPEAWDLALATSSRSRT